MVSLSHTLASLSDDDMMALVGPAAWANGLRLARSGAVREFSWSEDGEQAGVGVQAGGDNGVAVFDSDGDKAHTVTVNAGDGGGVPAAELSVAVIIGCWCGG